MIFKFLKSISLLTTFKISRISANKNKFYKMSVASYYEYKVFVTQPIPDEAIEIFRKHKIEPIINEDLPLERKTLLKSIKDVDALYCTLNEHIDKELLNEAGDKLKVK